MCPPLTDEPPTLGGGRGEGPDRPFASVTSRLARHYWAKPEKHSCARVRESKSSQPPQACFPKSYRTPRCNLSSEAYSYLSDHPRCQNRPLQQVGRHQAPFEPGARGPASPHRATLAAARGPTLARRWEENRRQPVEPGPPRWPGPGLRPPALQSRALGPALIAAPPHPPALAFLSQFPSNLCERLFSPLGCLFLAHAESGVLRRGRGPPRRAVPLGVTERTPSAGAGKPFPSPRGPAPGQQRPCTLSARSISPTLQVASRARAPLSRPGLPRLLRRALAGERQRSPASLARRPSRLRPPNINAAEPSSNLPRWA